MPIKYPPNSSSGGKHGVSGPNIPTLKVPPKPKHYGG